MGKHYSHEEFVEKFKAVSPYSDTIIFNSQYEIATKKISCICLKCERQWETLPWNLLSSKTGCPHCSAQRANLPRRMSKDEFEMRVNKNNPNLELLEEFHGLENKIQVRCNSCGYIWNAVTRSLMKVKCPCCTNKTTVKGINDIATTHPDWVSFFKNKLDSEKYTECSGKFVDTKCPNCGYERKMQISKIYAYGFKCANCSDGISYPNKIIRSVFQQLSENNQININDYRFEYTSNWTLNYRYDVWFRTNDNKEYLIEMDGRQHYSNKDLNKLLRQQEIDKRKDELASQNGRFVIRIDCQKSDADYIISNIRKSNLYTIFNLNIIDTMKCHEFAKTNLIKQVVDYYNNNQGVDYKTIGKIFKIETGTIRHWIKQSSQYGLCEFAQYHHKPVYMFDTNFVLINKFDTLKMASQYLISNSVSSTNNVKGGADKISKYIKSGKPLYDFYFSHESYIKDD